MYVLFLRMESQVTNFPGRTCGIWPRAAVFDCDGLLIDTADCWRDAFVRTLREHGRELAASTFQQLSGASVGSAADMLGVSATQLRDELEMAFRRAKLTALPGAALLTERLRPRMPLAVATNGPRDLVSRALEQVKLRHAFDAIISAETEQREKPAPDVYRTACAQLGVDPSDAIAFEDSAIGAQAARRAGLTVVVVTSTPNKLMAADLVVQRLDDNRLAGLLRLDDVLAERTRANDHSRDGRPDDPRAR